MAAVVLGARLRPQQGEASSFASLLVLDQAGGLVARGRSPRTDAARARAPRRDRPASRRDLPDRRAELGDELPLVGVLEPPRAMRARARECVLRDAGRSSTSSAQSAAGAAEAPSSRPGHRLGAVLAVPRHACMMTPLQRCCDTECGLRIAQGRESGPRPGTIASVGYTRWEDGRRWMKTPRSAARSRRCSAS